MLGESWEGVFGEAWEGVVGESGKAVFQESEGWGWGSQETENGVFGEILGGWGDLVRSSWGDWGGGGGSVESGGGSQGD